MLKHLLGTDFPLRFTRRPEHAIWWLSLADFEAIGDTLPLWLPAYVQREYSAARDAFERTGQAGLRVAPELEAFPDLPRDDHQATALERYAARCVGIALYGNSVPALEHLPGVVTDLWLRRWR